MKKTSFILVAFTVAILNFAGCSSSTNSGDNNDNGSYTGSCTVGKTFSLKSAGGSITFRVIKNDFADNPTPPTRAANDWENLRAFQILNGDFGNFIFKDLLKKEKYTLIATEPRLRSNDDPSKNKAVMYVYCLDQNDCIFGMTIIDWAIENASGMTSTYYGISGSIDSINISTVIKKDPHGVLCMTLSQLNSTPFEKFAEKVNGSIIGFDGLHQSKRNQFYKYLIEWGIFNEKSKTVEDNAYDIEFKLDSNGSIIIQPESTEGYFKYEKDIMLYNPSLKYSMEAIVDKYKKGNHSIELRFGDYKVIELKLTDKKLYALGTGQPGTDPEGIDNYVPYNEQTSSEVIKARFKKTLDSDYTEEEYNNIPFAKYASVKIENGKPDVESFKKLWKDDFRTFVIAQ